MTLIPNKISPSTFLGFTAWICFSTVFINGCDSSSEEGDLIVIDTQDASNSSTSGLLATWKADGTEGQIKENEPQPRPALQGLALLGNGQHTLDDVQLTLIGSERDGLNYPRDLAFNDVNEGELWVVSQADDSAVIYTQIGTETQKSVHIIDPAANHFMEEVSSIAFGSPGRFATCQESGNTYNNQSRPNLFMGPTLWDANLNIFGKTNPDAVRYQGFDLGSHLDMLHESPYCMGIAWAWDEAYWVFEGLTNSIALVDFRADHGPGFDDHSDGVTLRYAPGQIKRVPGIPSHLAYDDQRGILVIADTGNQRIGLLNVKQGGEDLVRQAVKEPGTLLLDVMDGADIVSLPNTEGLLAAPSGIALHDDLIYVSDAQSGVIVALTWEGEIVDWLHTNAPGVFGLEFDQNGHLYLAHGPQNLVVKISPLK
jgi:hypothetical protein